MIALILAATAAMAVVMGIGWAFQRARNNGGWTDVFWTFGLGLTGAGCALWPLEPGPISPRQGLVAALAAIWACRLGLHMALRVARSPEDPRYREMRRRWGAGFQRHMALFLPTQAVGSLPLLAAIALAAHGRGPGLALTDLIGVLILAGAVIGEGAADRQLARFRADRTKAGKVCDAGLWRWSRHPNYFFEWLGWLAYPAIAIGADPAWPWSWLSLAAPAAMYLFLTRGTGIPPLERHMLASRGQAFRDYQARTSAFFLLPPKTRGARP